MSDRDDELLELQRQHLDTLHGIWGTIKDMNTSLNAKIDRFRTELKAEIGDLRTELHTFRTATQRNFEVVQRNTERIRDANLEERVTRIEEHLNLRPDQP